MILASNNGPLGIQPHGVKAVMINRGYDPLVVGHVVVTSFAHANVAYPGAETAAGLRLSPFSCVQRASEDPGTTDYGSHSNTGFIGVVTSLLGGNGAVGSEVEVQFGGIVNARVQPASPNNAVIGTKLYLHNSATAGHFTNQTGSAAPDTTVAIALGSANHTATTIIPVLLFNGPIDGSNATSASVP